MKITFLELMDGMIRRPEILSAPSWRQKTTILSWMLEMAFTKLMSI